MFLSYNGICGSCSLRYSHLRPSQSSGLRRAGKAPYHHFMDLVLFGIQGCGKGTQAKKLAAESGYRLFEAGGELRKIKASGTVLGKEVASYIDVGKLVPHAIIIQVVKEAILRYPKEQQILFDGIPRDLPQMRDFDVIMTDVGRGFRCVHIFLPEEVAFRRIVGRAKVEGRTDDADEGKIRQRMQIFQEQTMPVIDEYRRQGKIKDIDGDGTVEEVYARLKEAITF